MIWLLILALLIFSLVYAAYKYGIFDKFQMQQGKLLASQILYLSYQGAYQNIGPVFQSIRKDVDSVFKFSDQFGFYYDNPETTQAQLCRAIVGIIVNQGQQFKIKQFRQKYPTYKQAQLKTTKYLFYQTPFINVLSIILMVKTIYPKIHQFIKKQQINLSSAPQGMMQVYKCVRSDRKIQVILFLQNPKQFQNLFSQKQKAKQLIRQD